MRFALLALFAFVPAVRAETPAELFERKIMPIFKSPNPSSCTQCHLGAVDLKDYIRPTHRETFLSLRDQGLVDLDHPDKSKILLLIEMGKDSKTATENQRKRRRAETEAFAAWIKASSSDATLRAAPKRKEADLARPAKPNEVIRHGRKDRLLSSFENTVWAMRFRCANCHAPDGPSNKKHVEEFGERVTWMGTDAESTLNSLMTGTLVNLHDPEKSLLLLKALNAVKHGGGVKFTKGDEGYKAFRRFLDDYAKVALDKYAKAGELPKSESGSRFGSEIWLKIENTPQAWADQFLTVKLFAKDTATGRWQAEPIATSDRVVAGDRRLWQHNLTLHASAGSALAKSWKAAPPTLAAGSYLVKVYVVASDKFAKDWTAEPGEADFAGQIEIRSRWPSGYGKMTVVDAAKMSKE